MVSRARHPRDDLLPGLLLPGLRTTAFERRVVIAFVVSADTGLIESVYYGGQDFAASLRFSGLR